jgi:membrane protease YdiL (CAAX protease family)
MWVGLIWYCVLLTACALILAVVRRVHSRGSASAIIGVLWLTVLVPTPIWQVAVPPARLGWPIAAQVAAFIVGGSLVFYGLLTPRLTGMSLRELGWHHFRVSHVALGACLGAILSLALQGGMSWSFASSQSGTRLALMVITQTIGVAWQEETVFRGYIQTLVSQRMGGGEGRAILVQAAASGAMVPAIALASGVFLFHLKVGSTIDLFVVRFALVHLLLGLVFGAARQRSGSMWPSYSAHVVFNVIRAATTRM